MADLDPLVRNDEIQPLGYVTIFGVAVGAGIAIGLISTKYYEVGPLVIPFGW